MDPGLARDALRRHVLEPMLTRSVDEEDGGFLVDFDDRWRPIGPHDKSLEHAARTTIAFAQLDSMLPGEGCDSAARHGCAFLQEVMWDSEYSGFFARVGRTGEPRWKGLKHPHAVTYAAQAFQLSRHLLPEGDGDAWTARALAWLDDVAWDDRDGGYWGSYRRTNERYEEGARLPTPDGRDIFGLAAGFKELNTHSDAIEMLDSVVANIPASEPLKRRLWLVDLVVDKLINPHGALSYAYRRDWNPALGLVRVGHQFQTARRIVVGAYDPSRATQMVTSSCRLVDFCLKFARHPKGGFRFAVMTDGRLCPGNGASTDARLWWVQFEALHALQILSHHEAVDDQLRARYLSERDDQWSFVQRYFLDERHAGIREVPPDRSVRPRLEHLGKRVLRRGRPAPLRKSHPWKDPYHEVGTLAALAGDDEQAPPDVDARSNSRPGLAVGNRSATRSGARLDGGSRAEDAQPA
jgi:mannose/cellobiose epimerase-like protein (N-acyl-D-glucosamine 2-epimerase family)